MQRTAVLGALLVAAGLATAQEEVLEVRIGSVAPLSGGLAPLGRDNENGVRLALEEANEAGLRIGGRPVKFVLLSEDDQAEPRAAIAAAQRLVQSKAAGIVGHLNSGASAAAAAVYEQAGIPVITGSATNPRLTEQGHRMQFRVVARDDLQGAAIGRFLALVQKFRSFAVIDDGTAYGEGLADEVERVLREHNRAVVLRYRPGEGTADWRAVLEKLLQENPDAMFFGGMDDAGAPFLDQARKLGIRAQFVMGDGGCLDDMAGRTPEAAGMVCTQAGLPPVATSPAFQASYRQRFNGAPLLYAPFTYDAARMLVLAMLKADSAEPARYLPELQRLQYTGATGRIAFDLKGDRRDAEVTVFIMQNGRVAPFAVVQGARVGSLSSFRAMLERLAPDALK